MAGALFGSLLSRLGEGVMALPDLQRRRRIDEEESMLRRQQLETAKHQMEQEALRTSLAQNQTDMERQQLEANLAKQDFETAYKTFEGLPSGTPLSPEMGATAEKYNFPTTRFDIPRQIRPIQNIAGTYVEDPTAQVSEETMPKMLSRPFETQRLLGEFYRQNQTNQRFDRTLQFREQQLLTDTRLREIANSLRSRGLAVQESVLAQRIAMNNWQVNDQAFDNLLNRWLALSRDPQRQQQLMMEMFDQAPAGSQMPPLPEPPTAPTPSNATDPFGLLQ